jgi:hypothetical protein
MHAPRVELASEGDGAHLIKRLRSLRCADKGSV